MIYFVPCLECMAAFKIATILWNQTAPGALKAKLDESRTKRRLRGSKVADDWWKVEAEVMEKVSLLPQPALLNDIISCFVKPIGNQILEWEETHIEWFQFQNIPKEFHWTSQWTLDRKKIAEAIVRDRTVCDDREKFALACIYCIETLRSGHDITHNRTEYRITFTHSYGIRELAKYQRFWIYDIKGGEDEFEESLNSSFSDSSDSENMDDDALHAFEFAVSNNNRAAAEYYFQKLTPEEREQALSVDELDLHYPDIDMYRFLLLHMNKQQQLKLLKERASSVLAILLNWPCQELFLEIVDHMSDILDGSDYYDALSRIVEKMANGYGGYRNRELFRRFWLRIPMTRKKCIIPFCKSYCLLQELFYVKDQKNILLILKAATPEEKEQIIFGYRGVRICSGLAASDEWDLLKFFISECLSTRDKMIHFKEECEKSGQFGNEYFQYIDELIEKGSGKRGREETGCPMPKRLCSSSGVSTEQV